MTREAARRKALRIWPGRGHVEISHPVGKPIRYRVGTFETVVFPMFFIEGEGDTWEAAFAAVKLEGGN